MPSKNSLKQYSAPAYYHVYNRGAGGQAIYRNSVDRRKFLGILQRHLDADDDSNDINGVPYQKYDIELVAYCLMGNHFHMLVYQPSNPDEITKFMRSVSIAYTMYFNTRYRQRGHLFQAVYRASLIADSAYLLHISRYIHLNPRTYKTYRWSSLSNFIGKVSLNWVHPERINDMPPEAYMQFLEDYEGQKEMLATIKKELE